MGLATYIPSRGHAASAIWAARSMSLCENPSREPNLQHTPLSYEQHGRMDLNAWQLPTAVAWPSAIYLLHAAVAQQACRGTQQAGDARACAGSRQDAQR